MSLHCKKPGKSKRLDIARAHAKLNMRQLHRVLASSFHTFKFKVAPSPFCTPSTLLDGLALGYNEVQPGLDAWLKTLCTTNLESLLGFQLEGLQQVMYLLIVDLNE